MEYINANSERLLGAQIQVYVAKSQAKETSGSGGYFPYKVLKCSHGRDHNSKKKKKALMDARRWWRAASP